MSPPRDAFEDWQQRCERFRRLSTLLGEDEATAPLHALALGMQQSLDDWREIRATRQQLRRWRSGLLGEMDTVLVRSRGAMFFSKHMLRPFSYSAADLREESRLCREEAQTADDVETRRALAAKALGLAYLGEEVERTRST